MTRSADDAARLPAAVTRAAARHIGEVREAELLGGLSGRLVARLRGPRGSIVAKGPVGDAERQAARGPLAEAIQAAGVSTARCHEIVETGPAGMWLILEDLPSPLPRRRWGADPETVAMLRALHSLPPSTLDDLADRYQPEWDEAMTERAVRRLTLGAGEARRLDACRAAAQRLFYPEHVISADPNPLNWRVDATGRVRLIDWERLTLGSTAIDLAILLPGLPDIAAVDAVRARYGPTAPPTANIVVAKAWTVVELAATAAQGSAAARVVADLRTEFVAFVAAASTM